MSKSNNKEDLKDFLKNIKKNEKKVKSKMSKHINSLQEFIKNKASSINDQEIELLFQGEDDVPGIMSFCATKTKFSGSLKNSALTALKFVLELLNDNENPSFRQIFSQINSEYYKLLELHMHCFESKENKKVAFEICKIIKNDRPYLALEDYLRNANQRQEFETYYSRQTLDKKSSVQLQKK